MDPLLLLSLVLGLCVGSFLNVLISRLPDPTRTLFKPARSACPGCGSEIRARDNIPVVSYLLLGGKCRGCRKPIGLLYPVVELLVGAAFVFGYATFGATLEAVSAALFLTLLVGIAATDAQTYLIPDLYTIGGAAAGVVLAFFLKGGADALGAALDGLLIAALLFGLGFVVSRALKKDALGFGDVLMVGMMATFLGFGAAAISIYLGAISGVVVVGAAHLVARRRGAGTPPRLIPFGVHLAVGGALALLILASPYAAWIQEKAAMLDELLPWA
jgi:leader peptidase (prepilin peptidase)/N-methyltransferase